METLLNGFHADVLMALARDRKAHCLFRPCAQAIECTSTVVMWIYNYDEMSLVTDIMNINYIWRFYKTHAYCHYSTLQVLPYPTLMGKIKDHHQAETSIPYEIYTHIPHLFALKRSSYFANSSIRMYHHECQMNSINCDS